MPKNQENADINDKKKQPVAILTLRMQSANILAHGMYTHSAKCGTGELAC